MTAHNTAYVKSPAWLPHDVEHPLTYLDLARSVAAEYRLVLTDAAADAALWEHTGFPSFWHGDPATECATRLREHFASVVTW